MTHPTIDPDLEELLRARLRHLAEQAPASDSEAVLETIATQQTRRPWRAALIGSAAAAALVMGWLSVAARDAIPPPSDRYTVGTARGPLPAIPDGWRWEAYHDVAVAVPDTWGYGTSGVPYCAVKDVAERTTVGRPGAVPLMGCSGGLQPDMVAVAGTFVDMSPSRDLRYRVPKVADGESTGDRTTRIVGATAIEVQARQPLRDQILATITPLPVTGANGCRRDVPLVDDPSWRPAAQRLPRPDPVTDVAVCTYDIGADGGLRAATQLPSSAIRRTVEALSSAPQGGTPDRSVCSGSYGDQVTLLRMSDTSGRTHEVVLRYAGCAHRGIDDGSTVRALTKQALADVLIGPHRAGAIGMEISDVVP
ncbi:hypothetical protein [Janibacter melonis]|uniref:hypothetical protein n=1 Tax=Janibacter melonis TaxID=262209 RepID=UPI00174C551B|nr:hypothetical protein [Janibacter melonis]